MCTEKGKNALGQLQVTIIVLVVIVVFVIVGQNRKPAQEKEEIKGKSFQECPRHSEGGEEPSESWDRNFPSRPDC